jgi:outer membrane protein OmpA-like peptidoglycan-associated protein
VAGCGPRPVAQPAQPARPAPTTLIALLPDPDSGVTGRASVTNGSGSVDLTTPRAATRVAGNTAPGSVMTMSDADVNRVFGRALAALPAAPRHFILQFKFESDVLTEESSAIVPEILKTVKETPFPEVVVVGHTDTMGDSRGNFALGLRRANSVRDMLVKAGLGRSTIEVSSHGEADLLVKTPDNTPEPRNRRVEITVR